MLKKIYLFALKRSNTTCYFVISIDIFLENKRSFYEARDYWEDFL